MKVIEAQSAIFTFKIKGLRLPQAELLGSLQDLPFLGSDLELVFSKKALLPTAMLSVPMLSRAVQPLSMDSSTRTLHELFRTPCEGGSSRSIQAPMINEPVAVTRCLDLVVSTLSPF